MTTAEYNHLIEIVRLTKDDRVELLNGEIVEKVRISPRHAACVKRLSHALWRRKADKLAIISVQHPLELAPYSELEPDLALLKRRADYYAEAYPTAKDVLLAVEVADTTIVKDREVKLPIYARAGIQEAWLVDLNRDILEIQRAPHLGVYQEIVSISRGQQFVSPALPHFKFNANELFV